MARNPVGFAITDTTIGWSTTDFDDLFIRKECFLEGGLWLWGRNNGSQLGDTTVINRSSPVQTISGGTNWRKISASAVSTGAVKTDGTIWLWGSNYGGILGDNTTTTRNSPVQTINATCDWKDVIVGYNATFGIKNDGTLWAWGQNSFGRLGTNDIVARSTPVQVGSSGTSWKQVSARSSFNTGGIKIDGTLWMWGGAAYGMLGNSTTTGNRSSPVQTASSGTDWKQISVGSDNVAAIKTDGTLWTWGRGGNGELGHSLTTSRSSPNQTTSAGTNWKQVSVGNASVGAVKTDGTLWMWGINYSGNLGTNDRVSTSLPVQTFTGGTNWKEVSVGQCNTAGIKTDGTLWTWGKPDNGILGSNALVNRSTPAQTVSGGTNWRSVTTNNQTTVTIREDCW